MAGRDPGPGERLFLTDFGLARWTQGEGPASAASRLTRTGETLGTPAYMAPEQARGEGAGLRPAVDVWALGCVLYELLAARPAFTGDSHVQVVAAVLRETPPPLHGVPRRVERLVRACLAKRAPARPAHAAAVAADCRRVLAGAGPRAGRPAGRRLALAAVALLVAGAVAWSVRPPGGGAVPPAPVLGSPALAIAERGWRARQTDLQQAMRLLEQALALDPTRHEWRIQLGLLRWGVGDPTSARAEWATVPPGAPERAWALWHRAFLELAEATGAGRRVSPGAFEELRPIAAGNGEPARLARAALAFQTGELDAARQALEREPGWQAALLLALVVIRPRHQLSEVGERAYDRAIADGPAFAWAFTNRGNLRYERGDLDGAAADYGTSLALHPGNARALVGRATVRRKQGDLPGALADISAAIAADPTLAVAHYNRAMLRQDAQEDAGVKEDLDAAIAGGYEVPEAYEARGLWYQEHRDLDRALADCTRAAALDPNRAQSWYHVALVQEDRRDAAAALAAYDRALALDDGFEAAHVNRAGLRLRRGDLAGARADCDAAVQGGTYLRNALGLRAQACGGLGDWSAAVADLERLLALCPPGDPWHDHVAQDLAQMRARARAAGLGTDH